MFYNKKILKMPGMHLYSLVRSRVPAEERPCFGRFLYWDKGTRMLTLRLLIRWQAISALDSDSCYTFQMQIS